jgi:hypothetical protein
MKSIRKIFIISGVIALAALGFVAYQMFWGPDHIQLAGRSLPQLLESGDLPSVLIIPGILIICAITLLPFLRIIFPAEIKNGVTAQAKVIKVWDTGVSINDNPQVGLLLEISPMGSNPFQAEAKTVVSRLNAALVQPGVAAEVKYDPKKPKRIQILTLHIQGAASTDTAARLEELTGLRDKSLITEEEYRQKREDILKSI